MARKARNEKPVDQIDFKDVLTKKQIIEMASIHDKFNINTRVMLATLTRTRTELIDGFSDDPGTLLECIEGVIGLRDHLEATQGLTRTALARLLTVGLALTDNGKQADA